MKAISDFFKNITSNKQINIKPGSLESFENEMILSICVLLIEVSKSDDDYDDLEKTKIIDLLEKQFSLNHDQIDTLMKMADKKNNEIVSLHEFTASINKEYTYSFVMRHSKNRITSIIVKNELVLVEVYHNTNKLDTLPENGGYRIIMETGNIVGLQKGLTGYKDGHRVKWLTTEHKFIEMIKPNTNNPCLNYLVLRNSGHLSNYLKLFPEYRFQFETYRNKVHSITQLLHQYYIAVFVKKEVDKKDIPFALKPLIYDIHGLYLKDKESISWQHVKNYIYELEPKRLQFVINKL